MFFSQKFSENYVSNCWRLFCFLPLLQFWVGLVSLTQNPDPETELAKSKLYLLLSVSRIRDVYPGSMIRLFSSLILDPNFFHPGSASTNLSILTQKMVSKIQEIWSGLFIPDPDPDFLPIPDPRVKKAPDPGSGSATLFDSGLNSEEA